MGQSGKRAQGASDGYVIRGGKAYPIADEGMAAPQFADLAAPPKTIRIPLDAAASHKREIIGASSFIWVVDASSPTATTSIQFANDSGTVKLTEGFLLGGFFFSEIYKTHAAQAGAWIDIMVGRSNSQFFAVNPAYQVSTFVPAPNTVCVGNTWTMAGAGVETILAADGNRQRCIVQNRSLADVIRVGYLGEATATDGFQLVPGDTHEFLGTAAIDCYGPSANSIIATQSEATA